MPDIDNSPLITRPTERFTAIYLKDSGGTYRKLSGDGFDLNQIILNQDTTGTPTENAGIKVERGTSTDALFQWNETNDWWEAGIVGTMSRIVRVSDAATTEIVGTNSDTFTIGDGGTNTPDVYLQLWGVDQAGVARHRMVLGNGFLHFQYIVDPDPAVDASVKVGDLTVTGNLTVSGTTTTLDVATIEVEDPIMFINKGASVGANAGIQAERGSTGADALFQWNETNDYWEAGIVGTMSRVVLVSTVADINITGTESASFKILASGDGSSDDVTLIFNDTNPETLMWDASEGRFVFSDDLEANALRLNGALTCLSNTASTFGVDGQVFIDPNGYTVGSVTRHVSFGMERVGTSNSIMCGLSISDAGDGVANFDFAANTPEAGQAQYTGKTGLLFRLDVENDKWLWKRYTTGGVLADQMRLGGTGGLDVKLINAVGSDGTLSTQYGADWAYHVLRQGNHGVNDVVGIWSNHDASTGYLLSFKVGATSPTEVAWVDRDGTFITNPAGGFESTGDLPITAGEGYNINLVTSSGGVVNWNDGTTSAPIMRWRGVDSGHPANPMNGDTYYNNADTVVYVYDTSEANWMPAYVPPAPCWLAGTPVLMVGGYHKPIEQVAVGDMVVWHNPVTGFRGVAKVESLVRGNQRVVRVNGSRHAPSYGQHLFTRERGWVVANDLKIGEHLVTEFGRDEEVQTVEVEEGFYPVYDVVLEGNEHSLLVSGLVAWDHSDFVEVKK